ncbi:DUF61 family protein [Saccharolobus islandicus]|uniref:DUF61 family protein n=1 Tax=Saccharolobus islandicus (strain M.16.27) TaxID=427318 RepID=C3N5E3_SACI3|nr:DUF61 family protein [Sulfolobus islandicus]ACP55218.1 conserved hypothetical protein [Sulfolobus islandicus M.16.27]
MIDKIFEFGLKDIFSSSPAEYVTIKDALEGKLKIRLNNNFYHEIKKDEVERLSSKIPLYLWSLVKIPFIFIKSPDIGEYFISGEQWNRKAISILLGREISNVILNVDVEKLLREYTSLIFIILSSTRSYTEETELSEM